MKLSKLKLNPNNPRLIKNDKFKKLVKSLKDFPEMMKLREIVYDKDYMILGGNMRYRALLELGYKEVPDEWTKCSTDLTKEQQEEFTIKDNIGFGEHDWNILANEWDSVQLAEWGLDVWENLDDKEPEVGLIEDDEIPEVEEAITKQGDLWLLGEHRVLCGDATKKEDVERLMDGQKADMVFTDPPYGVNYEGGHFHSGDVNIVRKRERLSNDLDSEIYSKFLPVMLPFIDGAIYMWFADSRGYQVYKAIIENNCQIHALIIWHKINATYAAMNAQYKQRHEPCLYFKPKNKTLKWCGASDEATLWEIKRDAKNDMHPTQKPVALGVKAISNHNADTVLDLFLGSGSTLIACEKTNRKCYGMEIDPHYCDVIVKRWEEYTGNKAERLTKTDY